MLPMSRRGLPKPSIPAVGKDERQKNSNLQYGQYWIHVGPGIILLPILSRYLVYSG